MLSSVKQFLNRQKWKLLYLAYIVSILVIAYLIAPLIGITAIGSVLSLIQVVADLLIVVPTIIVFIWQIASTQSAPVFDLRWGIQAPIGSSETSLELPNYGTKTWNIMPILTNTGDAVTSWYLVSFLIPEELLGRYDNFKLYPIVGNDENHWKTKSVGNGYRVFTFMSNGQIASYPDYDLELARLEFTVFADREYQNSYEIKYVITSDKGKRRDKTFVLKTHKEDLAKKISVEALLESLLKFPSYRSKKR